MQNDHFPFIYCVEALVYERKYLEWESCFEELGLESKPITDCYSSRLGQKVSPYPLCYNLTVFVHVIRFELYLLVLSV